jgi:hypothetical protein
MNNINSSTAGLKCVNNVTLNPNYVIAISLKDLIFVL